MARDALVLVILPEFNFLSLSKESSLKEEMEFGIISYGDSYDFLSLSKESSLKGKRIPLM